MLKKIILISGLMLMLSACSSFSTQEKNPITKPSVTAASYNVQLGMSYLQQGDVQRAKSKLLLALAQAPNWPPAHDAMGYFFETTGDLKKAKDHYEKAVAIDPRAGAAQNNYGTFLCRTGHYQQADQHFMLAVQDTNYVNTAEAYENAGLCAMQIPDDAKATGYFQKAIQQDPRRAIAFLELAQINFKQNNLPQAQQYFNNYLNLSPKLDAESIWLGLRLAHAAHDKDAIASYTMQLQNEYPNSAEYRQLLATQPLPKPNV